MITDAGKKFGPMLLILVHKEIEASSQKTYFQPSIAYFKKEIIYLQSQWRKWGMSVAGTPGALSCWWVQAFGINIFFAFYNYTYMGMCI